MTPRVRLRQTWPADANARKAIGARSVKLVLVRWGSLGSVPEENVPGWNGISETRFAVTRAAAMMMKVDCRRKDDMKVQRRRDVG